MLRDMPHYRRVLLRAQSGPGAGLAFAAAPTAPETTLDASSFQALARRRLRMPLALSEANCEGCKRSLDQFGDHRAACTRAGRLKSRACPVERIVARICREAGGRVQTNAKLRDMNIAAPNDDREMEVLVSGLPCLAVDVTVRSSLDRNGEAKGQSHWSDTYTLDEARRDKESRYPELLRRGRCRLVVVGVDVAGRMREETVDFLDCLARAKARAVPVYLQKSAALAFRRRWSRMLAVSVASSFAASLLLTKAELRNTPAKDGLAPWLLNVLAEARLEGEALGAS